jgi:hypothetical protein
MNLVKELKNLQATYNVALFFPFIDVLCRAVEKNR